MSARPDHAETSRWLRYASDDLINAQLLLDAPDAAPSGICVLAQQAAEKALKAVLAAAGLRVPRTHDLRELRALARAPISTEVPDPRLTWLSDWLIIGRYPGDWSEASHEDAAQAVAIAEALVASAVARLAKEAHE